MEDELHEHKSVIKTKSLAAILGKFRCGAVSFNECAWFGIFFSAIGLAV
jgi:hypothetical protein